MVACRRHWGSLCLLALALMLAFHQTDASKAQSGSKRLQTRSAKDDDAVMFTSSSKRAVHKQQSVAAPHQYKRLITRKTQKIVKKDVYSAKAQKGARLTDAYFSKKVVKRSTRGEAVQSLIATLNAEGKHEFGHMVTLEEDTYSLNVHNNLLNHMRVSLPSLMDNYQNPTWVEDHPMLNTEVSPTSFFHQCYSEFKNITDKQTNRSPVAPTARSTDEDNTTTSNITYTRRAACMPDFMVIGAHGLNSEDIGTMLQMQSRHVLPVNFNRFNYWDYRQCTEAVECEFDYHPPTFADYKQIHQHVCEHVRRQSFYLEDRSEFHPDLVGDVFSGILNWNPCWKQVPGNEGRLAPRVTTAHHVHALLPDLKVLVLMRDPMKKTLGLFRRTTRRPVPWTMEDAQAYHDQMTAEIEKFEECKTKLSMTNKQCVYHFVDNGEANIIAQSIYHVFVEDYKRIFPADNIKYHRFEDFRDDENAEQEKTVQFFGVPSGHGRGQLPEQLPVDPGVDVFNSTRTILKDFFRPHNEQLQILIGPEFKW